MKIVLELLDQSSSVRKITVRHDIVIGRGSDCNLRLSAPQVSRRHCFLRVSRESVSITDLDSSNGTWVNGTRITSGTRCDLTDGTQISLGPVRFLIHVRPEAVSGAVLPGGVLNEVITESAGSADATTYSGRADDPLQRPAEPRTSSVHALQPTIDSGTEAADSRLEIVELGRQLSIGSSAQDAVVFAPSQPTAKPRGDRLDTATTAHDMDLRGIASLDSVDVLDPGVLSGQFPPDRPMWSRQDGQNFAAAEPPLPPTLQLNPNFPPALDADVDLDVDVDLEAHAQESDSAPDDNNDDMGPELHAFLKGL